MLKSVRFWTAVLLVLFSIGYTIFRKQYLLNHASFEKHHESVNSAVQTEHLETSSVFQENTAITAVSSSLPDETLKESELLSSSVTESYEQPESTAIAEDASVPYLSEQKITEILNQFRNASNYSEDLIGWIYLADSDIDYPVVQGDDNQYYLYHAPDKTQNQLGSVFLDCHCNPDFSDNQNILFGHNMQSGMFGDIRSFKDRECFEQHRYGWLFTKNNLYRIDFFALVIVSAYDSIYDIPADNTVWLNSVKENSLYDTEMEISESDCFLALSTCASDFEDARALFTGKLVRIRELIL